MKRLVFAFVTTLLIVAAPARANDFAGVVTRVSDGDTVWVRPDGERRRPVKLRLQGIDAPERCQAWGEQSTAALSARVLGRRVAVHSRASDDYGRLLVDLRLERGGDDVGAWMVGQGHAWSYRFRHHPGPYANQEAQARAASRGLFKNPNAEPPGQFRKRHGPCEQIEGLRPGTAIESIGIGAALLPAQEPTEREPVLMQVDDLIGFLDAIPGGRIRFDAPSPGGENHPCLGETSAAGVYYAFVVTGLPGLPLELGKVRPDFGKNRVRARLPNPVSIRSPAASSPRRAPSSSRRVCRPCGRSRRRREVA